MSEQQSEFTVTTPLAKKSSSDKSLIFFKKADGISYERFLHVWRKLHYPMAYLFSFDGYVQNSKLPAQPKNMTSPYDGVVGVWFDTQEAKSSTYASPFWHIISRQEPMMLKQDSMRVLNVDEYVVLDGPIEKDQCYSKLIIASEKKPSVSHGALKDYWLSQHAFDVIALMVENEGLLRYTISIVDNLPEQINSADTEGNYSVVEEFWFQDTSMLEQALASKEWQAQKQAGSSFVSRQDEIVSEEFIGLLPTNYS
ncbi:EthD domain-containing protein [Vibrio sp. JC009]|uniref:EthD domain-containing protein n=1 Tax=Vibrio sp. JC009 TaxID=2912314 RepID=UPI0023B196D7|nr:EthD domain-containing protein [Vibrio sp. JC009]WED23803.1 EthD domain-containing protein [Vibrio sp. JC009]